ncbi:hypothetical protein [Effusibacillus consociatus]
MLNLLTLFTMIPFLALPITLGGYGSAVEHVLHHRVNTPQQLYRTISGLAFFLSSFLNLATLPMMYYSVKDTVAQFGIRDVKRFTSLGIIHGYALPILWTPVAPIVGIVMDLTKVNWLQMFPLLFGISVCGLVLDWILNSRIDPEKAIVQRELAAAVESSFNREVHASKRKLVQIAFSITLFITLIILLEWLFPFGLVITVALTSFPYAALWAILLRQSRGFMQGVRNHISQQIPKMAEQFAIFLSAGFFVKALQLSGYSEIINRLVLQIEHSIGVELFLILLPLFPLFLAYLGMHPVVAITLLAQSLNPAALAVSAEGLTIALLGGAVATFIMGPFNATLGIMSSITKESAYRISVWSWPFTICFLSMLLLILLIL